MATAKRADIFSDGNGRLAFSFATDGGYSVITPAKSSLCSHITIPAKFADRIPFGVTDVVLTRDGDLLVLDLAQLDSRV